MIGQQIFNKEFISRRFYSFCSSSYFFSWFNNNIIYSLRLHTAKHLAINTISMQHVNSYIDLYVEKRNRKGGRNHWMTRYFISLWVSFWAVFRGKSKQFFLLFFGYFNSFRVFGVGIEVFRLFEFAAWVFRDLI